MQRAADWWLDTHKGGEDAATCLWLETAVSALLETLTQARPHFAIYISPY